MRAKRVCKADGCEKQHFCKGYCQTHFVRWKTHGFVHETMQAKKAREKTRHMDNPEYQKEYKRRFKSGFTRELFHQLMEMQGGKCDICSVDMVPGKQNPKDPCADHVDMPHGPQARGVLCRVCNVALGHYEKHQRGRIVIEHYERYLRETPVDRLTKLCTVETTRQLSLSF